jgi:hypothetical protein
LIFPSMIDEYVKKFRVEDRWIFKIYLFKI